MILLWYQLVVFSVIKRVGVFSLIGALGSVLTIAVTNKYGPNHF